jgi:hypothetical protein
MRFLVVAPDVAGQLLDLNGGSADSANVGPSLIDHSVTTLSHFQATQA